MFGQNLISEINLIGKDNIRFYVPMHPLEGCFFIQYTSSNSPEYLVECYIDETRYKVDDDYKITLKACDERFGCKHYYICDLETHIKAGIISIIKDGDELESSWQEEPFCGGFTLKSYTTSIVNRINN